jgi:hypothetical protein
MISVMRDETNPPLLRLVAAKAAAPYVHPKLNSVELAGKDDGPIEHREITDEDRARAVAVFIAKTRSVTDLYGNIT